MYFSIIPIVKWFFETCFKIVLFKIIQFNVTLVKCNQIKFILKNYFYLIILNKNNNEIKVIVIHKKFSTDVLYFKIMIK